jgi:D-alanyl-D-alanine carboxypeptidase
VSAIYRARPGLIDETGSNLSVEWVDGGQLSSTNDLLTFAMALRNGRLLSSEATRLMQEWKPAQDVLMIGLGLFRIQTEQGGWRAILGVS